jgi:uncharacterized alpha-E superfamily protein
MLSRAADNLYWMSRYIERAENIARFIDVNSNLALQPQEMDVDPWAPLVYTTGDWPVFAEAYGQPTRENVLKFLTFDPEYPNSILSCLKYARENARTVRESISTVMWEEINKFYLMVSRAAAVMQVEDLSFEFFNQIKLSSHLISGVTDATMSHGEGWHFVRLGRLLERADKTSRILDVKTYGWSPEKSDEPSPLTVVHWSALLQSVSALDMYRRVYGRIRPTNVAQFLLLDRDFPRSIRFCLRRAEESVNFMTGSPDGTFANRAEQLLGRLRSSLDYTHIDDVLSQSLHKYIDGLQESLNEIGVAIHDCYVAAPAAPAA